MSAFARFYDAVHEDVRSVLDHDPAATSVWEVLLCYPGLHAIWAHRVHHWLWQHGLKLVARLCAQNTRFWTGVEIHPGARLGQRLFIDHGMGVVIGETAIVGNDVTLYQGVTLGGTGKDCGKRHPTIRNGVVIGAGGTILGNISIGENVRIGAGSVVLRDVPSNTTVVGVPGRIVLQHGERVVINDPQKIHDPVSEILKDLTMQVKQLQEKTGMAPQPVKPSADAPDPADYYGYYI